MTVESPSLTGLRRERTAQFAELDRLRSEHAKLQKTTGPRLAEIQNQADALAADFKMKFNASQEAFALGNKTLAKTLSLEGKEQQRRCQELNAEANTLRQQFKNLHIAIAKALADTKKLSAQISDLTAQTAPSRTALNTPMPHTKLLVPASPFKPPHPPLPKKPPPPPIPAFVLKGFSDDPNILLTCDKIADFIRSFPPDIIAKIREVEYLGYQPVAGRGLNGRTREIVPNTRLYRIELYTFELGENPLQTLAHEIGHVMYHQLSEVERAEWERFHTLTEKHISYNAQKNSEENFCEFVGFLKTDPSRLTSAYPDEVAFITSLI